MERHVGHVFLTVGSPSLLMLALAGCQKGQHEGMPGGWACV